MTSDHLNCYSRFDVPQRGVITITVSKPYDSEGEYGKLNFDLTDIEGNQVWWQVTSDTKVKNGSPYYIYSVCLEPGTYLLNIMPSFWVTMGLITFNYTIDFANNPYVITEPNQDTANAAQVKEGKIYKGYYGSGYYLGRPENSEAIKFIAPETATYCIGIGNLATIDGTTCIAKMTTSDGVFANIDVIRFRAVDKNGFLCRTLYLKKGTVVYVTFTNYFGDPILYQVAVTKIGANSKGNMGSITAKLFRKSYNYTGKAIEPFVNVENPGFITPYKGENYFVKYENNIQPGIATVKIVGFGDYYGTIKTTFKIMPPQPRGKKASWGKSSVKIYLKKYSANVTGFQVRLSNYESMKKSKVFTFKGAKPKALTVKSKKMIYKKKCWLQIRAYKQVGKKTLYSAWGW